MSPLVENTQAAEQARELQQLAQLGEFVGTTDFKRRMRAHLMAEAATHHTPLLYHDAAGHLVEEWVGFGELSAGQLDSVLRQLAARATPAWSLEMAR